MSHQRVRLLLAEGLLTSMLSTFAPTASDTASTRCGGATTGAAATLAL